MNFFCSACAYQLVVGGETHDAFQFGNLQHSHLHIDQPYSAMNSFICTTIGLSVVYTS